MRTTLAKYTVHLNPLQTCEERINVVTKCWSDIHLVDRSVASKIYYTGPTKNHQINNFKLCRLLGKSCLPSLFVFDLYEQRPILQGPSTPGSASTTRPVEHHIHARASADVPKRSTPSDMLLTHHRRKGHSERSWSKSGSKDRCHGSVTERKLQRHMNALTALSRKEKVYKMKNARKNTGMIKKIVRHRDRRRTHAGLTGQRANG
ncbi:uncharacterized protein LOC111261231 [Varroa jacobsoni]|uniref:uncharacterized protein LOC111261231 n=1 Tax=Varroa jacobsoni TaxID=62625 RepID=UPI000BF35537|nr:uncharacterized protein LOC111261231 [Varroa jacobsoni]